MQQVPSYPAQMQLKTTILSTLCRYWTWDECHYESEDPDSSQQPEPNPQLPTLYLRQSSSILDQCLNAMDESLMSLVDEEIGPPARFKIQPLSTTTPVLSHILSAMDSPFMSTMIRNHVLFWTLIFMGTLATGCLLGIS
ncbi:hypothetical protein BCR33DRAFT_808550 [Rhizoclosmatium globosum]|uniref:Uncharacterized protein n=1 Tax=Rhizoclosmatium globosum TaxID=329046 RepID=A0A1Y2ANH5_9FUNG|nr:hypothetical protein BCR33DRAFT_808550 [Rhizoclosmatium globosum]|eukprot:ORY24138.1 hypothetical protein BCR33DRAFT_808550 [Rhizoclosmatium globosum]